MVLETTLTLFLAFTPIDISQNINNIKNDIKIQMNIDIKSQDPYQISKATPQTINKNLKNTYLENMGDVLYEIEQKYGVNYRLIYAVGKLESGNGKKLSAKNNYYGIKDIESNYTKYKDFKSKEDCVRHAGAIFGSKFYKNRSLKDINSDYCPNDPTWSTQVQTIMLEI